MQTVVLATRNKGKIKELSALLQGFEITVLGLDQYPDIGDIPETGDTFEENASIKARAVSQATGLVALADDSGLAVDALGGAPGVYSARYSGENATDASNTDKLLKELADTPRKQRAARFICCMVAMAPGGESITASGSWEGFIASRREGHNGFGYDPVFFDPELKQTAACLAPEIKNSRSHRGKALAALLQQWPSFWQSLTP